MTERETSFSDQEKEEIAQIARVIAREGEEMIWAVSHLKVQLMKLAILGVSHGLTVNGVHYTPNELRHKVDIVHEVVNQADLIFRFEGRDFLSELGRRINGTDLVGDLVDL